MEIQWDFPPTPYPPGEYLSRRYEMRSNEVAFPIEFTDVPDVWVRLAGTVGLDASDYQEYDFPWGDVVDTTTTTCVLRTYVYEVETGGPANAWWPARREDVRFAFTVAGPVDPSSVPEVEVGTTRMSLRASAMPGLSEVRFWMRGASPRASRLTVHDASGRLVRTLFSGLTPESGSAVWDTRTESGAPAPSGVYFAKWNSEDGSAAARFVVVR
jgi:hypothetical protein